jgi:hypothetical protein
VNAPQKIVLVAGSLILIGIIIYQPMKSGWPDRLAVKAILVIAGTGVLYLAVGKKKPQTPNSN